MKTLKQSAFLLIAILFLTATSCKKEIRFIENGYDQPNGECLVTHTEDDLFGYSLDIFYNEHGNPDSMSFEGFPVTIQYDSRQRLVKANFGTAGVHFDFLYKDNTFLPSVLNYYRPDYGGLIGIDSFHYNLLGELIKMGSTNLLSPQYNLGETFDYDDMHNVTKVTWKAENGGTIFLPAFTAYEVSKYDHKLNFMSANQWIKYLMIDSELDSYDFMMFSKNNAVDWHWGYQGGYNPIKSTLEYDNEGFANKVNLHLFDMDGVTEELAFTRTSSSTCDEPGQKSSQLPLKNSKLSLRNLNHIIPTTSR